MCAFENELSELNKTRGDMSKVQVSELKNEKKRETVVASSNSSQKIMICFLGTKRASLIIKKGGGWAKGHDLLGEDEKFICDMNSPYE